MKIIHRETGYSFGEKINHATGFFERGVGLMFRKEMGSIDGLLIEPCNSIHNCFVRFPIDVLFLDKEDRIVKIIHGFKPWRFSWIYFRSRRVLELPAGKIPNYVKEGDAVEVMGV